MVYPQDKIDKADRRAKYWQSKLFKKPHFDEFMDAIYPNANKAKFDTACVNAGMTPEENAWLWNYLQHCDNLWMPNGVMDRAATTGW